MSRCWYTRLILAIMCGLGSFLVGRMSTSRNTSNNEGGGPLDHLPDSLLKYLGSQVSPQAVTAVAPCDLNEAGKYVEAYLVLADGRLGYLQNREGKWESRWVDTAKLSEAKIVEGLGVHMLRLLEDDKVVAEYRFTLRHAKVVAKIQRQLERSISGDAAKGEPVEEAPRPDEKKLRCDKCGRVIPAWSEFCPACMSRRKILSRVLDFVKPYKKRAIAGIVLSLTMTLISLIRPYLIRPMTDRALLGADYPLLIKYVLFLAGLTFLLALGRAGQMRLMAGLGSRVAMSIRDAVYAHLHKLSLSFFARRQTGSLVTRVTNDSDRLWQFVSFTLVELTMSLLTLAGVGVVLFVLNWKLACFVLVPLPVMVMLTVFFHKRLHTHFRNIWHRWAQMTAVVADALPGVRVIKAFSQEEREIDRFGASSTRVYTEELKMINVWTTFAPVMMLCSQIGVIIVWLLGGWWVVRDIALGLGPDEAKMTIGTLMSFVMYMEMFLRPIHQIAHMDQRFNRAATSAARIFDILDTQPGIFSKSGAHSAEKLTGEIELRNVSFSYDGIRKVLKNVNLKIVPGEMVGLAGPSGGGKTTLVNLICRFYDVLEGQILIDGVDVRDYDISALRQRIGVVLQEPFLFHGTVAENIAYGNPDATLEEIIESSRAANAHEFIVSFPDGYDTVVGERGQTLSGGERQRISIARAILNNPTILILDEATSSVDTETEKLIQEALDRLVANRTTIAIAHRLSTLRKANRLVIMDSGVVKEIGSHEELAGKEDGLYAKLLRTQVEMQSVIAV